MGHLTPRAMDQPSEQELLEFYSQWFERNYMSKPAKPSVAVLGFARAVLERYGSAVAASYR